jgi:hypothetical protein
MAKQKSSFRLHRLTSTLWHGVWFFPLILSVLLITLTSLRISGSSVGIYHQTIYGAGAHDPDLLFGKPQPVRSDEWLVSTQLTISQAKQGYPKFNKNIGSGKDMALVADAPYKEWFSVFKPENLSFFVLPLEYAFAFKWWFLLYVLIVSCYFFTLRIIKGRRLFAAIFGLAIGLSPFLMWWYIPSSMLSIAYGFLILLIGMRIIDGEQVHFLKARRQFYSYLVYALTLAYLLTSYALVLYPPFQIAVSIVILFFLFGYLLNKYFSEKITWRDLKINLAVFSSALLITGLLVGLFYLGHKEAINAISNTVYPGARLSQSGGLDPLQIFDGFLQPQLQLDGRGAHFLKNQSEASNFILLSPFLVLPALFLTLREYKEKRRVDWTFAAVQLIVLIFFLRAFLPFGDFFYKMLLLDRVPNTRLVIGMGFAGVLLILLTYKKLSEAILSKKIVLYSALIYTLICFAMISAIGLNVSNMYPKFISYAPKILFFAAVYSLIIFLFLLRKGVLAAVVLLLFSFGSVIHINPLYKGLGWLEKNQLYSHIQTVSSPHSTWVATDTLIFENFGLLANRDTISGVQPYPDINIWQQADPKAEYIYNRYAHVLFINNPPFKKPLRLVQMDFFEVGLTCNKFTTTNVDFVLNTSPSNIPCLELKDKVAYPGATFYLYRVVKTTY